MLDGFEKAVDPPKMKKLPVEVDVPEFLVKCGLVEGGSARDQAVRDLALVAFYYLLRAWGYMVKSTGNDTKQTVQFKLEDVTFFKHNSNGQLRKLACNVPDLVTLLAETLKLDNQKKWAQGCVN